MTELILNTMSITALLAALYSFHRALTPPQPPASHKEQVNSKEKIWVQWLRFQSLLWKPLYYILFLLEAYVCFSKGPFKNTVPVATNWFHGDRRFDSIYPNARLSPAATLSVALIILGGLLRISAYNALGNMYTWEISIKKSHRLVTTGPYAFVRHPGYAGSLLNKIGYIILLLSPSTFFREYVFAKWPIAAGLWTAMNVFSTLGTGMWLIKRTKVEDGLMEKEFEDEWRAWKAKTRYKVLPFLF